MAHWFEDAAVVRSAGTVAAICAGRLGDDEGRLCVGTLGDRGHRRMAGNLERAKSYIKLKS